MTKAQLLAHMDAREFGEWVALFREEAKQAELRALADKARSLRTQRKR